MKLIKKISIILGICVLLYGAYTFTLFYIASMFTAKYPNTEWYRFNVSTSQLIEYTNKFKDDNPEYKLNSNKKKGDRSDHLGDLGNFYHFYFYLPSRKSTVHCIIRMSGDTENLTSEIGLNAISEGTNFASWKSINTDDLTKEENKELKKKFETEILDKLGKWKHKRWYNQSLEDQIFYF